MFGLVGPDGAGKTTLLRVLAGVISPDDGTVEWHGGRAGEAPVRGYLSQGFSLYQDLSVDENIEFFAEIHGVENFKARSEELLSFVGLLPFRSRAAGHLSGGMKKKLALACALVHNPRVLLLDEPTTGVDPVSRRGFWLLLVQLLREGITILISTPYLDEAERCMRVGLLQEGRFLALDTPERVKSRIPGNVYEVISEQQQSAYRVLGAEGGFTPQQLQPFGDRLHVLAAGPQTAGSRSAPAGTVEEAANATASEGREGAQRIRAILEESGVPYTSVREVPPSLENAFISLVRERRRQP
jgi:ABC-2 type transport system ATP-binding protein